MLDMYGMHDIYDMYLTYEYASYNMICCNWLSGFLRKCDVYLALPWIT